ncbi:MAG TPA: FGGY-family carbohydrate kinase [Anaerolineae bacterium]|nr:FGGY-family carbohydrate kinase [Anaerolineae bacterium]HMR64918.1 FGGY-family carbohydrate kinase [Anaerolineae bacterium]
MEALFLGIDAGTTTTKAGVYDLKGNEVSLASRSTKPVHTPDGSVLQDMNAEWREVAATIREAVHDSRDRGRIQAIGVTAQGDGLWMLDKKLQPVQEAVLWIDGRSRAVIERWDRAGILGKSGRVVFSGSPLAFSAWFYKNRPEVIATARHILFCKDWIKYCLTGELATDETDLSDASLIDVRARRFSPELLELFGVEPLLELLPPIYKSTDVIGYVTPEAAAATGLQPGIPVVNGMIDVAASAIGTGVLEPYTACSIVGTTVYNEIVVDKVNEIGRKTENQPSLICHGQDDRWLLTFGTMLGTPNLDWFLDRFCAGERRLSLADPELVAALKEVPVGSDGIIFHPYLGEGGERAPFVKPTAAAQFFGLKAHHTRYHLVRAVCEGVAYSMRDCFDSFPIEPKFIRIAGGGSKSSFWCQIFASCLGKPIEVTHGDEIGAKGAAIIAAVGQGHFASLDEAIGEMVRVKTTYDPVLEAYRTYSEGFALYTALRKSLWNLWEQRNRFLNTNTF